jgi:hypothetical protein
MAVPLNLNFTVTISNGLRQFGQKSAWSLWLVTAGSPLVREAKTELSNAAPILASPFTQPKRQLTTPRLPKSRFSCLRIVTDGLTSFKVAISAIRRKSAIHRKKAGVRVTAPARAPAVAGFLPDERQPADMRRVRQGGRVNLLWRLQAWGSRVAHQRSTRPTIAFAQSCGKMQPPPRVELSWSRDKLKHGLRACLATRCRRCA